MSIANLTSEQSKLYLDINVNNINAQSQTVEGELTVADLNVTNFTIGAIESNTWTPVIVDTPSGGCSTLVNGDLVEARFRKINNLVQAYCVYNFNPSAGANGEFNIGNLPSAKISNWTLNDSIYGNGISQKIGAGDVFLNSVVADATDGSTQKFTCFCSNFADTALHRITLFFHYTTD